MLASQNLWNRICELRIFIAVLIYLLLFILLYPHYQYILDDDGVAYATITRRWAEGDYFRAINGLWSPLHSWLAVPFYKAGLPLTDAFRCTNAIIGIGLFFVVYAWLKTFNITMHLQTIALVVMLPFVLYISFFQLAADNLFCFIFLLYLKLCSDEDAFCNKKNIIITGIAGGLLYLAKAYGLPFVVLHFTLWQIWLYRKSAIVGKNGLLIRNLVLGFGVLTLVCLPWIAALYHKYNLWTISLNVNYGLMPHEPFSQPVFVAPPWPDSPTPWEDPFIHNTNVRSKIHWMDFWLRLPKEVAHNVVQLIQTLNRFSFFGAALAAVLIVYSIRFKERIVTLCTTTTLLLPFGYVFLHIEDRFLWPLFFLLLICGIKMLLINQSFNSYKSNVRSFIWVLFFASFLVTPIDNLQNMWEKDKEAFALANQLRDQKLTGRLASNGDYSFMRQVAFHAGNQYYESTKQHLFSADVQQQLEALKLDYYYLFYTDEDHLKVINDAPVIQRAKRMWQLKGQNLLVLEL